MVRKRRLMSTEPEVTPRLLEGVRRLSKSLYGWEDLDPLLAQVGDARFVLLGEASHGTAEYYDWRAQISMRLIQEHGFSFIAVEGDWPDCYRINRFIKDEPNSGERPVDVLRAFERWPTWMWANHEIEALIQRLRRHNHDLPEHRRVGFYGLDVYSLWDSMHAVTEYLEKVDHGAAETARRAFHCFEPYGEDVYEYARATNWVPTSCEDEVVRLLLELQRHPQAGGSGEEFFNAEQNALVAKNAEHYYRTMVRGDAESWNIRDRHMMETLNRLVEHHGPGAKAIVWEHNTHVGDARFTDMADSGMVNVGQLVREEHAADGVVLVGFSSYEGSVIAGHAWDAPMEAIQVPPGREGSWEDVLHTAASGDKLLLFQPHDRDDDTLRESRGHRAIGVVYNPHHEQYGNYVPTVMPLRYDALLYIDETHALHPLGLAGKVDHEAPETYPTGL